MSARKKSTASQLWVEMAMKAPNGSGQLYLKSLMVMDGKTGDVSRMIMQMPPQPPMELPAMMMNRQQAPPSTDVRDQAADVGAEEHHDPCRHVRL